MLIIEKYEENYNRLSSLYQQTAAIIFLLVFSGTYFNVVEVREKEALTGQLSCLL